MKTASVKTETMVALASLALESGKKLFQKGNLERKRVTLTLSGANDRIQRVFIDSYTYWGLFSRTFPQTMKLNHSVLVSDGGSRFKICISHIHNYTEYNQQWNVSQIRSMDSAIICNTNTREYINIGMKKRCKKITNKNNKKKIKI